MELSTTVTPPAGAGFGIAMLIDFCRFCPTAVSAIMMVPTVAAVTVTLSAVSGMLTPEA